MKIILSAALILVTVLYITRVVREEQDYIVLEKVGF